MEGGRKEGGAEMKSESGRGKRKSRVEKNSEFLDVLTAIRTAFIGSVL